MTVEEKVREMARRAAEAMAELGSCNYLTWQERRDALLAEGREQSSGFDEVASWLEDYE